MVSRSPRLARATSQPRIGGLIVGVITFALSTLWAVASPVFSIPDENAHGTKAIAQVNGQVIGDEVDGIRHLVVDLPPGFEYRPDITCFAFQPEVTADCAPALGAEGGTPWFNTWVGTYNPVYYAVVGLPALALTGNDAVIAMRVVSALLSSALWGLAAACAMSSLRRQWAPAGVVIVMSPMIVYFSGAVNPQGFEIAGAAALWWGGLRLAERWRESAAHADLALLWSTVVAGAFAVSNARATGPLWVLIILFLLIIVVGWRSTWRGILQLRSLPWLLAIAVPAGFSALWTLIVGSLSNQAEESDAPLVNASPVVGAWYMIRQTPLFVQQAAGFFGWLDTPLPAFLYLLFFGAVGIPVIAVIATVGRSGVVRFVVVVLAAFVVPVALQAISVSQTGIIWQGRYGLFLYIGVVIVSCWLLSHRDSPGMDRAARRLTPLIAAMLGAFGWAAFVLVLRRYMIGIGTPITGMLGDVAWTPPISWVVLALLYFLASLVLVAWATSAVRTSPLTAVRLRQER